MEFSVLFDKNINKINPCYLESRLNIRNTPTFSDISQKTETLSEFIESIKYWFLNTIEKGYILSAFQRLQKAIPLLADYIILDCYDNRILNKNQFGAIFRHLYTWKKTTKDESLFPEFTGIEKLLEIFSYCPKRILLPKKDYNTLCDHQIIYRGSAGKTFEESCRGLSWTTDLKVAEKFVDDYIKIFNLKNGMVLKGLVSKNNIIGYFKDDRYEYEIIVNPIFISNIEILNNIAI